MDLWFYVCMLLLLFFSLLWLLLYCIYSYALAFEKKMLKNNFFFWILHSKRNFQIVAFHCSSLNFRGLKNYLFWSSTFTWKVENFGFFTYTWTCNGTRRYSKWVIYNAGSWTCLLLFEEHLLSLQSLPSLLLFKQWKFEHLSFWLESC